MRCLLVEKYSNSRQVWSSRSFLQFLRGLRPNLIKPSPALDKIPLRLSSSWTASAFTHEHVQNPSALTTPCCELPKLLSSRLLAVYQNKAVILYTFYLLAQPILAEGAIALSVTLSGGALFASWKLLQFLSSLIVKVILAIFTGASAQLIQVFTSSWQDSFAFVIFIKSFCVTHERIQNPSALTAPCCHLPKLLSSCFLARY